jgi:glycosyltransferase involved in cell wall biosynthesis
MEPNMTTDGPLNQLSVLVSSYNKGDFLSQSEKFLHEIAYLGAQVVIIEDSSTDGSIPVLKAWPGVQEGSIELVLQMNAGSAVSRNNSVVLANREYLLFVDIDDVIDVEVLLDVFPQVIDSQADLALTGFIQVPSQRIGPYPLENFVNTTTPISNHRTELLHSVGWWRYLYKKSTVDSNNLRFLPSFEQMGNKIFVLDDLLWLLHIFSLNLDIYRADNSHILYQYFLPDEVSESRRKWYLDQVALMPRALLIFLQDLQTHTCTHDEEWLYKNSRDILWQHANFLGFFQYVTTVHKIIEVSLYIDNKLKDHGHLETLGRLIRTTLRLAYLKIRSITNSNPTPRT